VEHAEMSRYHLKKNGMLFQRNYAERMCFKGFCDREAVLEIDGGEFVTVADQHVILVGYNAKLLSDKAVFHGEIGYVHNNPPEKKVKIIEVQPTPVLLPVIDDPIAQLPLVPDVEAEIATIKRACAARVKKLEEANLELNNLLALKDSELKKQRARLNNNDQDKFSRITLQAEKLVEHYRRRAEYVKPSEAEACVAVAEEIEALLPCTAETYLQLQALLE
jgi:hypothetical protein